ncbi:unnamed protein product [Schistosoma turkestanicum]|nr:unnamed protein product [Schistosoma turkestanicum]
MEEKNDQAYIPTHLSTLKSIRADLIRRCDQLVARLEQQTMPHSTLNINEELNDISESLVSLAHKLDDPDYSYATTTNDNPSLMMMMMMGMDKFDKRMHDLQEIQNEFIYIEGNLQRLKCTMTTTTTSTTTSMPCCSNEFINKLNCIEEELYDMQMNLQNKITYLNNFHAKYTHLMNTFQIEYHWIMEIMRQLEIGFDQVHNAITIQSELSDSPMMNIDYTGTTNNTTTNNHGHLQQDLIVFYNLIHILSQYHCHKLLPLLQDYDQFINDHHIRLEEFVAFLYHNNNTNHNLHLPLMVYNLWNKLILELIPKKLNELITRSYEQIIKNLSPTFNYLPTLQSLFDALLLPNNNLPESNSLQCHVNIISDHINAIQGEINWLHQYIRPIIMNNEEDRNGLYTDTITNTTMEIISNTTTTTTTTTTNIDDDSNINRHIIKYHEIDRCLTQLLNYFIQISQQLSLVYIPSMEKYYQCINDAMNYYTTTNTTTIQYQLELFQELALSVNNNNNDNDDHVGEAEEEDEACENDHCQNAEHEENIECILITYEKLETLCTAKEQCLELLETVENKHRIIMDELLNIVKQCDISMNKIINSSDNKQNCSLTQTMSTAGIATTTNSSISSSSSYLSKFLDPIELISQRFLHFITEIQKVISEYDELISRTNKRLKRMPQQQQQQLSVNNNDMLNNTSVIASDASESEMLLLQVSILYFLKIITDDYVHLELNYGDSHLSSIHDDQNDFIKEFDEQYEQLLNEYYMNSLSIAIHHHHHHHHHDHLSNVVNTTNLQYSTMINAKPQFVVDLLERIDCLKNNLLSSRCQIKNDDLVNNRLIEINKLHSDVANKFTETLTENEQLHVSSSSEQMETIQMELNALKSTFKQSSDFFQHDIAIAEQNEVESKTNMLKTSAELLKKRLNETIKLIDKLEKFTDEINTTDIYDYLLRYFKFDNHIDNRFPFEMPESNHLSMLFMTTIPLWYKQTQLNDEIIDFLEYLTNHREQLSFGYEMAERLNTWLSITHPRMIRLKMKLQQFNIKLTNSTNDYDSLCSLLHDVTLYRLELFTLLPMCQSIRNDINQFKNVMVHLNENQTTTTLIDNDNNNKDKIEQIFSFNNYEHEASLNNHHSVIHHVEQQIMTIINDCKKLFTESSVYLSTLRIQLIDDPHHIPMVFNELIHLLNEFKCCFNAKFVNTSSAEEAFPIDNNETSHNLSIVEKNVNFHQNNYWSKVNCIEIWFNELNSMQNVLDIISNRHCLVSATIHNDNNNDTDKIDIENEVKQLKLNIEQQYCNLTKTKIQLTNEINQEKKLRTSLITYSTWLTQSNDKLIQLATPNHLNLNDTMEEKEEEESAWEEFKDWTIKAQNDSQLQLISLINQLPDKIFSKLFKQHQSLFTNLDESIIQKFNQSKLLLLSLSSGNLPTCQTDVDDDVDADADEQIQSCLELPTLCVLRKFHKFQKHINNANRLWHIYIKSIQYFTRNFKQLQLVVREIQLGLVKLYRPSKLVGCCTRQLNSVKNAIEQLKTYEQLIVNLYNCLPIIKSICHPVAVSQTIATISTMKQNFTSLMGRAIERRKILMQALKEDIKFNVAYYSLLNWFLTKLEILESFEIKTIDNGDDEDDGESIQLSMKTLHKEYQQRQSDFHLVMRLGGNLRERCTCTDPEKNILNEMLEKLQLVKGNYGKRLSKCQLQINALIITKHNAKSALSSFNNWLQMIEEQLGLENNNSNAQHTTTDAIVVSSTSSSSSSMKPKETNHHQTDLDTTNHLFITSTDNNNTRELLSSSTNSTDDDYLWRNFSYKEYVNIVSVLGDLIFVQSLNSNHSILIEDLQEHEKLYQKLVTNHHNHADELRQLTYRFKRLKQACNLRGKCLQIAAEIASQLNINYSNLTIWLFEAIDQLNHHKIELNYHDGKRKSTIQSKQSSSSSSFSNHFNDYLYKIGLNLYARLHYQQIHVYRSMFNQFETMIKQVIVKSKFNQYHHHHPDQQQEEGEDEGEHSVFSVYCDSKCRQQFLNQYKHILNLWHKLDQSLQCLRLQLSLQQAELFKNLTEFELEEQWIAEETIKFNKSLTRRDEAILQNQFKQTIPNGSSNRSIVNKDSQLLQNNNNNNVSMSMSTHSHHSLSTLNSEMDHTDLPQLIMTSSTLKEFIDTDNDHKDVDDDDDRNHDDDDDDDVADYNDYDVVVDDDGELCKDLEQRITMAKENFEILKNRESKLSHCINAYQQFCAIIAFNHDENNSVCEKNSSSKTELATNQSHHADVDDDERDDEYRYASSAIINPIDWRQYNDDRANQLKIAYYNLLNRSSQHIQQLECYHNKLIEHNLYSNFNFDQWKQDFLQWIANRHYRLSDIFNPKHVSATLRTIDKQHHQQQPINNIHQKNANLSKSLIPLSNKSQLSNSRSSVNLLYSSKESLSHKQHHDAISKQKIPPDDLMMNCSQFIQTILQHGVTSDRGGDRGDRRSTQDDSWANPILLKFAFHTIDQANKGLVTCQQVLDALNSKKAQKKPLETHQLIEHAIKQETSKCICQTKFQPRKIAKDRYCFGSSSRVYLVRFLNSTTIVRVVTHKTNHHFGNSTPIRINPVNTALSNSKISSSSTSSFSSTSTTKHQSHLGLINVTPINRKSYNTPTTPTTTTLNNHSVNSKDGKTVLSTTTTTTTTTSEHCEKHSSLNSMNNNKRPPSIHHNDTSSSSSSSLMKQKTNSSKTNIPMYNTNVNTTTTATTTTTTTVETSTHKRKTNK